jgi:lysyl-tRNA synthetase class 1
VRNNLAEGEGKLPWRLDWPAKWSWLGVTFEAFGKDHATRGGSFDTGREIIKTIYDGSPPDHLVYEWIHLKGSGAMHSSTGVAVSAAEMLHIAPPETLRWLVLKPQPQRHIDFDPGMGVLNLVDDYDRAGQARFDGDASDDSRAWELSQVTEIPEALPAVPYRHLVTLAQSRPGLDAVVETLQRTGELSDVSSADLNWLKQRLNCLDNWLDGAAPDSVRFMLQKQPPQLELNEGERGALTTLVGLLKETEWQPQPLHDLFYVAQEASGCEAKELFALTYRVLLGQQRGPRLGFFLATLDREWVIERLRSYA